MLAPLPSIVQVPDETAALPATPVLPMSRLDQPVGKPDCARTRPALIVSAHTTATADRAPPRISLFRKIFLPVSCRASRTKRGSRQCWPKRTCTPSAPANSYVYSQADFAGKTAATHADSRKTSTFIEVDPIELEARIDLGRSGHVQQLHELTLAQEIISAAHKPKPVANRVPSPKKRLRRSISLAKAIASSAYRATRCGRPRHVTSQRYARRGGARTF